MAGGAPSRVQSGIGDREFLVELFVNLFEVAGTEDSVREQVAALHRRSDGPSHDGADFRADVELWLDQALISSPAS